MCKWNEILLSQIRRTFRSIRNTLPDILYVFLLFLFSMMIFSLMALKLFGDRWAGCSGGFCRRTLPCVCSACRWQSWSPVAVFPVQTLQEGSGKGKRVSETTTSFMSAGFFSLCRWFLFRDLRTVEGSPYFTNILDIAFELYVLVTTANSPDVMCVSHQFTSTDICSVTDSTFLKATVREKNGFSVYSYLL